MKILPTPPSLEPFVKEVFLLESDDLNTFTEEDYKNARVGYEEKWNQLNLLRTIAALVSLFLILEAALWES